MGVFMIGSTHQEQLLRLAPKDSQKFRTCPKSYNLYYLRRIFFQTLTILRPCHFPKDFPFELDMIWIWNSFSLPWLQTMHQLFMTFFFEFELFNVSTVLWTIFFSSILSNYNFFFVACKIRPNFSWHKLVCAKYGFGN